MKKEKRYCIDCLHCKVSVRSNEKCRICYCIKIDKNYRYKEKYWQKKKICPQFSDMDIFEPKRRPLLKKRA